MGTRQARTALFDGFAEIAKALASGRRAELVDVLAQGERHVEALANEIAQSVANTSHHLQGLAAAGLVTTRREKNRVYYRLASADVEDLWTTMQAVAAAHLGSIEDLAADYVGNRRALEEISRDELSRRLEDGDIIVIDVRPEIEYAAGHVTGARSFDRIAIFAVGIARSNARACLGRDAQLQSESCSRLRVLPQRKSLLPCSSRVSREGIRRDFSLAASLYLVSGAGLSSRPAES